MSELENKLFYTFKDPQMLQLALRHKSHANEARRQGITKEDFVALHNERLEFLGDAVLSLAVSSLLYERYAGSDEGDLTRVRAHLVREDSLHKLALALGLPEVLKMSDGEARGGGAQRPSILADAVEAVLGAAYMDAGYDAALAIVRRLLGETIATAASAGDFAKDAKTALQEWLQARRIAVPSYRIVATRGQAHAQTFEVECAVPALDAAELGEGRSRRTAEQEAARRLLDKLTAERGSKS